MRTRSFLAAALLVLAIPWEAVQAEPATATVDAQGQRADRRGRRQSSQRGNRKEQFERQFESQGLQVGDAVPSTLTVYSLQGEPISLTEACGGQLCLLVSASMSCRPSQKSCTRLGQLSTSLEDQARLLVVYTLEAHPSDESSPYGSGRGGSKSKQEAVAQPGSLEERIGLAQIFEDRAGKGLTIVVDDMSNALWTAMGQGPNIGLLIDSEGEVIAKQGWFEPQEMVELIGAQG